MKKGKRIKRIVSMALIVALAAIQLLGAAPALRVSAENTDAAKLRLIFTTDLHGQVNAVDYSTGAAFPNGGLAKASTLINQARQEVNSGNYLTFDAGDVMYDYTTEYIYDYDETALQPIYQAMSAIGYDAITLGNHDFEYTLPYIQNQIKAAGLEDKVVLSNVKDAVTGKSVWKENMIIEKTLTTEQGNSIVVKVGIIGETIPTLSKKRFNYTGVLATEDIVANVQHEAQTLKAQGADVVVVIAHSGIGEETPAAMDDNVGYALTKVDNVDVVLCGHKHTFFCANGTTKYDAYPGVDTSTGLVNGKNLVMVANCGKGIGMVDLTLSNASGANQIVDRKSEVRKVQTSTKEDEAITGYLGDWSSTFIADSTEILCEIDSSTRLQNYFGTLEDDGAIQLLNDIGITYGLQYQNLENTAYKDLPVVSAAKYSKYGGGSGEDYYDISGNFTKANLYQLMNYRVQFWLYAVTGSQLKEWLEWSASAYETAGNVIEIPEATAPASESAVGDDSSDVKEDNASSGKEDSVAGGDNNDASSDNGKEDSAAGGESNDASSDNGKEDSASGGEEEDISSDTGTEDEDSGQNAGTSDTVSSKLLQNTLTQKGVSPVDNYLQGILNYQGEEPLQYVLQKEWMTDWSRYFVFDGVEYQIDTTVPPRYNYDGVMVNDTRRVVRATRNGKEIGDEDMFLLVVNRLDSVPYPSQFVTQALGHLGAAKTRAFFQEYMERESLCGTIQNTQDDNWSVNFSNQYQYVVQTGSGAADMADAKDWIKELLDTSENFLYYRASFGTRSSYDWTGPSLNLKSLNDEETHKDVRVAVQATDPSGIHSIRYLLGKYTKESVAWDNAALLDGYFDCKDNGIYSVLAMDIYGNRTVRYIRINNINRSVLEAPKVDTFTNRKANITGTAEPGATIYFELETGEVYKTTVNADGTFKYKLTPQNAGVKIYVYVTDSEGRASARTVVIVKRTGPNRPVMNKIVTSSRTITGELNDENVYPVFIIASQKIVYMQDDGTQELYEKSSIYKANYTVKKMSFNIKGDGTFSFELPNLLSAKTQVTMYTLDVASRYSKVRNRTVQQAVPAKPIIDTVSNLSKKVNVYCEEQCKSATITVGKKTYTVKKAKAAYVKSKNMYRYTQKIPRTDSGVKIKVYLTNKKGNSPVLSASKKELVPNKPVLNTVKAGTKKITGTVDVVGDGSQEDGVTVENTQTRVFVFVNGKKYEAKVSFEGNYTLKLKKKIRSGAKVSVKGRNVNGAGLKRTVTVK